MEKKEALRIIFQCADLYQENLCDRMLLIISANNSMNKTFATEILFERTNFMHLTGVKFEDGKYISPDTFYTLCLSRRLSIDDFELAKDGTTEQKLLVLPTLVGTSNLAANMIGDYYDRRPALITDKLAGNIRGCIGIVYDSKRKNYAPNTVLNLDMRLSIQNKQRIIATYRKHKTEEQYVELVYKAKKIDWSKIKFPDPYQYITILEK